MKICPYCKNENADTNKFCNFCGAPLENAGPQAEETAVDTLPEYEPIDDKSEEENSTPANDTTQSPYAGASNTYGQQPVHYNEQVTPIPIGGYIAWSIFVILFCTIPGAIALYYVLRINRSKTVEEQQKNLDTAKKILMVGTVLGVLNLVSTIAANM